MTVRAAVDSGITAHVANISDQSNTTNQDTEQRKLPRTPRDSACLVRDGKLLTPAQLGNRYPRGDHNEYGKVHKGPTATRKRQSCPTHSDSGRPMFNCYVLEPHNIGTRKAEEE
ncbi:hypothetical protein G7K_5622-t1 [Saitoella complicata NRRL Y-17804]|uniref:Uncharacterized protein n=1 Tax=Saitoella complicata (strain BCRC 22490 / CBS 7301 / JCM 7358 / NBRC 10748 / NRRL Y-17804) TaxID=698492 RepID=A0A0E9NNZ5_SAICN|nr:hypothetical protein G7K_5622-t1 [Saitoella complicata NRRL Y-17804]